MSRLESSQPDEWSQEPKSQSLGVSELDEFKKTVGEDWNVPLAFVVIFKRHSVKQAEEVLLLVMVCAHQEDEESRRRRIRSTC